MTDTTAPDGAQDDDAAAEASVERTQPAPEAEQPQETREPDALLAGAREFALSALRELVEAEDIGEGHRVVADDELLVTHLFAAARRGYRDWEWYVTLARVAGAEQPTVCESGMLPAQDALLAPEWVPWSERVRDSDHGQEQPAGGAPDGGEAADPQDPESADSTDSTDSAASADSADEAADDDERCAAQPPRRVDAAE